jgi:hypothetical protein
MRKLLLCLVMLSLAMPAFAQPTATPQGSPSNRVTWFNRLTDSMATMGKSETEKKRLIQRRKEDRSYIRQRKAGYVKEAHTQKNIAKQQKNIMKKVSSSGKTTIGL